jgi:hypothetical protein
MMDKPGRRLAQPRLGNPDHASMVRNPDGTRGRSPESKPNDPCELCKREGDRRECVIRGERDWRKRGIMIDDR